MSAPSAPADPIRREPARRAALELLQSEAPPTAMLAMSDVLALGALQAAAELGIAVPAELSIVGFDDSPAAELALPPLTTVSQPQEEKGRLAAKWLLEAIERGGTPVADGEERSSQPSSSFGKAPRRQADACQDPPADAPVASDLGHGCSAEYPLPRPGPSQSSDVATAPGLTEDDRRVPMTP